jgi:hypothetical protein
VGRNAGGDEDAYRATTHRCIGCQLLADKQKTVPDGDEGHGVKVFLIPTSVHAALQLERPTATRPAEGGAECPSGTCPYA